MSTKHGAKHRLGLFLLNSITASHCLVADVTECFRSPMLLLCSDVDVIVYFVPWKPLSLVETNQVDVLPHVLLTSDVIVCFEIASMTLFYFLSSYCRIVNRVYLLRMYHSECSYHHSYPNRLVIKQKYIQNFDLNAYFFVETLNSSRRFVNNSRGRRH